MSPPWLPLVGCLVATRSNCGAAALAALPQATAQPYPSPSPSLSTIGCSSLHSGPQPHRPISRLVKLKDCGHCPRCNVSNSTTRPESIANKSRGALLSNLHFPPLNSFYPTIQPSIQPAQLNSVQLLGPLDSASLSPV